MKLTFGKTKRPDAPAEPKPPPPLSYCFMLSHLEDDGPVRLDGAKLVSCIRSSLHYSKVSEKIGNRILARTGETD